MKKILLLVVLFSFHLILIAQGPGQFTRTYKNLIGNSYTPDTSHFIPGLEGFQFVQGSVASQLDDPEIFIVDIYRKVKTWLIVFSLQEDSLNYTNRVLDIVELQDIPTGWSVRAAFCQQNKNDNAFIAALVKDGNTEWLSSVKQSWQFNRDKRKWQSLPIKGIRCLNDGMEGY